MRNPFQAQEVTLKQTVVDIFRHTTMNPSEAMGLTIILTFSVLTFWLLVGTQRVVEKTTVEIFEDNVKILKLSQETLEFGQKTLKFSQETLRFSQETLESSHETKRSFVAAIQRMNATLESLEKHVAVTERAMGEFREAGMALEARLAGVEVRTEYLDGALPEC